MTKDILEILGWFNPEMKLQKILDHAVIQADQSLIRYFEVFNPELTVKEVKEILENKVVTEVPVKKKRGRPRKNL